MSVKRNLIANFAANVIAALVSLLAVPLYIRYMGVEAYGLVGVYGALQAIVTLLDFGVTATINREMARTGAGTVKASDVRNMVRSLEVIYWAIAIAIGVGVIVLIPFLSTQWLSSVSLSSIAIQQALVLIGLALMGSWPFSFYAGGLMGLQRQVILSGVNVAISVIRAIGAVLILTLISPTVQAFFAWQTVMSVGSTIAVAVLLWRYLPESIARPRFQWVTLRRVWRFSAGVSAVSILGLMLTQIDKVALSRILTLEAFGYYTLAGTICASLYMLVNPIYNAVLPRLTQLVARSDQVAVKALYHQGSEVLAALLLPAVITLVLFSYQVILIWTNDPTTALRTGSVVALMAIGTGLHGLAHVPWALQLAHGWTRLGFFLYAIAVGIFVPLIIVLANTYGAIGGAAAWALLNALYVIANQILMHRRILQGEGWRWFLVDVGRPASVTLLVAGVCRLLIYTETTRIGLLLELVGVAGLTQIVTLLCVPVIRTWLGHQFVTGRDWLRARKNRPTSGGGSSPADSAA